MIFVLEWGRSIKGLKCKWNVKDIMNYVIVRKFYGLGIHQHFIQRFNLNNNNPSVDFESMYNVSQLSFFHYYHST